MKKTFRILAIVLAATMLMCCCAFALDYGCSCGTTQSSAYSSGDDPEADEISASFNGLVKIVGGTWQGIGADSSISGSSYASCRDYYDTASRGSINSSHYIDGGNYYDLDSFGN